jgi:hypothetical protein
MDFFLQLGILLLHPQSLGLILGFDSPMGVVLLLHPQSLGLILGFDSPMGVVRLARCERERDVCEQCKRRESVFFMIIIFTRIAIVEPYI